MDSDEKIENSSESSNDSESENESENSKTSENKNNKDDVENDEDDDDGERTDIRGELKNMSFEDLMKLKDELGSKVYNEALFGAPSNQKKREVKKEFKRANKNRPREEYAKRPVPFLGDSVGKKFQIRDPRFDQRCGEYDSKRFKQSYGFIQDIRKNEIKELNRKLKECRNDEEKEKLKFVIQRLDNQVREENLRKLKEEVIQEEQQEIKAAIEEGKTPRYRTKKELKAKELVKQYLELKKSGKLQKHLERRRKKNAAKDRKKLSCV